MTTTQHPRHHCVLQYKALAQADEPTSGWYLYDLGSTHGTYLNKDKLKVSHYTRVRVGHQIKFGNSTRTYILTVTNKSLQELLDQFQTTLDLYSGTDPSSRPRLPRLRENKKLTSNIQHMLCGGWRLESAAQTCFVLPRPLKAYTQTGYDQKLSGHNFFDEYNALKDASA
ncbi:putative smad nuclear interacting protein [Operophtera brumata]|uniref:Putative smad nuclear interacting protein n=1 Tax=Operophtera brumata TaxID=104452 RepID=A0A0L7KPE2_OPEBR|nr:putative smad nuclear interacting protein [Operophtera brumata]